MASDAAEKVRLARKMKGWSQSDLGTKAGYNEKTIFRIEQGQPSSIDTLRNVAQALELNPSDLIDETSEPSVRKRSEKVRRMRDGQECMRLLVEENNTRWTRVSVERDPNDDAVHEAIMTLCEVVDLIRQVESRYQLPVRAEYEGAHKMGQVLSELEARGWFVELEQGEVDVYEKTHDSELYWTVRVRSEPKPERAKSERAKQGARSPR